MQPFRFLTFPLLACLLSTTACSSKPSTAGRQFAIFLDLSGSVSDQQRVLWVHDASRVVRSMGEDSSISVYGLHDHTMDSAPLFDATIPAANGASTQKVLASLQKARRFAHRAGVDAVQKALEAGGNAPRTDVFSAIDRIHVDQPGKRTVVVFFSDMLNSTPDFNMEKPGTLTRDSIPERIRQLAAKHSWGPAQLGGAEVYCVLNSIGTGLHAPPIDRVTQSIFYRALFEALGAKLVSYDTTIPANLAGDITGETYVAQAR